MHFWERLYDSYGAYIKEVYFPILNSQIGTGRPRQPSRHLKQFLESGLFPVSLLVNPVVLPLPVEEIARIISDEIEGYLKKCRLTGVTLANLSLAKILKLRFPDLNLTASALMEISGDQQLVMLGSVFDTIVPSNSIIRDIRSLTSIRTNFSGKIRLMVNESCLSSCVFRTQHFFEMSIPEILYPHSLCNDLLDQKPWLRLTGGWVLPQHLHMFNGLYDEIKLAGRVSLQDPDRYIRVLDSYLFERELSPHEIGGGPASVNYPLSIGDGFYSHTLFCNKICSKCSFCEDYWNLNGPGHG
jgi:hypothetical protein